MRKGYILTVDAMMALVFILTILLVSVTMQVRNNMGNTERAEFKRVHYITEDALEALNKQGTLDIIGGQWAEADGDTDSVYWSNASNISRDALKELIPGRMGYKLMIDNDTIYEHAPIPENKSDVETRSLRVLTGYSSGRPVTGYVSRAYLAGMNKEREGYVYGWQRTVSSGKNSNRLNITTRFRLPNDFKCNDAEFHAMPRTYPNDNMSVSINSNQVLDSVTGAYFNKTDVYHICGSLQPEENRIEIEVWDNLGLYEIGKGSGTRLLIDYNTSEIGFNLTRKFYLDAVKTSCGFKQQYSLLMPGDIKNITMHLETSGVQTVDIALVLNGTIYELLTGLDASSTNVVDITDQDIKDALAGLALPLDYSDLKNRVYSFNVYVDTSRDEYEGGGDSPGCFDQGAKQLLEDSYILVDYSPIPAGTDMYSYNFMSTPLEFNVSGSSCLGLAEYTTGIAANYSIPVRAIPWIVDMWPAWIYEGDTSTLYQAMAANNVSIYNTSDGADFERYMVRFGYTKDNPSDPAHPLIVNGSNSFTALGELRSSLGKIDQYCLSENLSSGTVTFLFRSFVDYGDVYRDSDGCNLSITFNDGTKLEMVVGNDTKHLCQDDDEDAIADSLNRLMEQLDWDPSQPGIDIKFTADQLSVESAIQSRVKSMWGPAIFRLVIWV